MRKMNKQLLSLSVLLLTVLTGCLADKQITLSAKPRADTEKVKLVSVNRSEYGTVVAHLSNGLVAIVRENHTAPVVCVKAYVRAGGLYEREWLGCGLSHLCEHLVAQESVHHPTGGGTVPLRNAPRSLIKEIGGQANAYTSMDHTCYHISAASSKTLKCLDFIIGQLAHPNITLEDFRREHGVVMRELEMGKDDPVRQMWYAHADNLFGTHPAAVPVIGYKTPLSKLKMKDVLAYIKRMYVPQNIIVVIAGDVDTTRVLNHIVKLSQGWKRGRTPDLSLPAVPEVTSTRRKTLLNKSIKSTMERISFQTIPLTHKDLYALDTLSFILSQGRSSRLVRSLVLEKRLASSVSSSSWTPFWGKGFFTISFRAGPEKADDAEKEIIRQLQLVKEKGVTQEELRRAKRQKLAEYVYSRQTVQGISEILASDYLSTGDVDFTPRYVARIQKVTADEVQQVAKKYFQFDKMVITRMVPASWQKSISTKGKNAQQPITRVFTLPNGLRVILHSLANPHTKPTKSAELVSMAFVARGGVLMENEKNNGIGALMTALSIRGAGKYSASKIDEFFDSAGGSISGNCGNNSFYWQATLLNDKLDKALDIFAQVIQKPRFDPKELEKIRPIQIEKIKQTDEHWLTQLIKVFRKKFFNSSPYRLMPSGALRVVKSLTAKQLADYHKRVIKAGSSVLAVYGSFDVENVKSQIEKLFADLPKGKVEIPPSTPRKVNPVGELYIIPTHNVQAGIIVAAPSISITNIADRLPLTVLDTIISGYRLPSGWLHEELRGKQLVYVVHAYNWGGFLPGAFITYAGCQPEKAKQVVEIIKQNLDRASRYLPTKDQIDAAVNTILTADALENQSLSSQAMDAALNELYGLGWDFRNKIAKLYRKITPADVRRVARKYLGKGYIIVITTPKVDILSKAINKSKAIGK
ncbi:MAG: insulinase family protein [Planctomycetes bacterium]|nr:insulinase family protein [Planctomycetota bacterium]